ncbi:MAG: hypothetical protein GX625_00350 [Clostridiaceae bacterium]|nr:hypothetical protein [Clostridiaceae bacterium]
MYCSNCNKSFSDDFSFCDTCGGKLEKENITETFQPVTPEVSTPQPEYQPAPPPIYQAPTAAPTYAPQPPQADAVNDKQSKTVSFGTWLGILFLNIIPFTFGVIYTIAAILATLLNLDNLTPASIVFFAFALFYVILLFIWAFGKPKARSLKNYAKATLLLTLIVIVLVVVGSLIWGKYIMDYVPEGFENFNFNMDF